MNDCTFRRRLSVVFTFTLFVNAAGAFAQGTVVRDEGVSISRQEFAEILDSAPPSVREKAARDLGERYTLINQLMLNRKLIAEANAMQEGDPGYDELQLQLDGVKRQFAFDQAVAKYGLPDLVALTEERYASQKDKYAKIPETRASSHILLYMPPGPDRTELREQAATLLQELRDGANFEEYVERYSGDPGSKPRGGSIDRWARFGDPELSPPYTEALFAIENVGAYSEVTDTQFGVHIIRLDGIRKSSYKTFDEVKTDIARDLLAEYERLVARAARSEYELTDDAFIDGRAMEELFAPYK